MKDIPAFPNKGDNSPENSYYDGMTLRDYFAGQALIALSGNFNCRGQSDSKSTANMAYCFADAMLEARNNTQAEIKQEEV